MYPNYSNQNYTNSHNNLTPTFQVHQPNNKNIGQQNSNYLYTNNYTNTNRQVYASMIQPTTSNTYQGLGKLQTMGRLVKQEPQSLKKQAEQTYKINTPPQQTLSFKPRPKMAASMIFPKANQNQINATIHPTNTYNDGFGTSKLDALIARKKQSQGLSVETIEDQRKRQIQQMKNDQENISKKFDLNFKKQNNQPYLQLPTRKPVQENQSLKTFQFPNTVKVQHRQENKNINPQFTNTQFNNTNTHYTNSNANFSNATIINTNNNFQPQINQNYNITPQTQNYQPQLNKLQIKKEEGMFKKKNAYTLNQEINQISQKKALLLSPKNKINSNFKEQYKFPQTLQTTSFNQKGGTKMKKFDSINMQVFNEPVIPKIFKKSDFSIGKKMGKGQFGQVMLVQHKLTGFICGMKIMSKKQIKQQKYQNQVARQLSIQFYLSHRNIASLYGYFTDAENIYLLIEFATEGQLLQLLRKDRRMEEADCSPIIRQISEGLDYIHKQQIIHRDIKPQNILFTFNTVKICDFGWAVHCGNGMRRTIAGSPLYYSPQVVLETKYDQKIDIWAIGMMTYECLLGKIPFRIYSQLDLKRIVSEQAKDFILKICKKVPQDRMQMRQILRHPFLTRYLKDKRIPTNVIQDFRRIIG